MDSISEGEYLLEGVIKERMKKGKVDVYKGNPKIWNVLDNSYDPEQKVRSQLDVNDQRIVKTLGDSGLTVKGKSKDIESDVEEDIESLPSKTKYYD